MCACVLAVSHLTLDKFLRYLYGGLTECSSVLGTHFCANVETRGLVRIGLWDEVGWGVV